MSPSTKICCYCSKRKRQGKMTIVPTDIKKQKKWIDILGGRYAEKCTNVNVGFICRSHFELDANGRRSRNGLPKPLPFCTVSDDSDEECEEPVEEEQPADNNPLKHINLEKTVSKRNPFFTHCCYCEEPRTKIELTRVPTRKELRQEWIDVLGEEFAKRTTLYSNPLICLSHFEIIKKNKRIRYALPKPLPFRNSFAPKSDAQVKKEDDEKPVVKRRVQRRTCVYCAKILPISMLTHVPENPGVVEEWGHILGPEFIHNNSLFSAGMICLSHFELLPNGRKPINALPIPLPGGVRQKYRLKVKEPVISNEGELTQ